MDFITREDQQKKSDRKLGEKLIAEFQMRN